jgi:cellulose synthase/poly-beta-1,6-N-acetylglucosamine synthase-like glycosyltransferase
MMITVLIVLLACYALLLFFYIRGWQRMPQFVAEESPDKAFLSVIIPARNEAARILPLLTALQKQTYPFTSFEIILVDDFSEDNTAEIVRSAALPNLTLIQPQVDKDLSSKKKSIEQGIAVARGELIITTDADCIVPATWLSTINSFYQQNGAAFIAAPVQFTTNGSLLQNFQAIDFMMLQGITGSSVAQHFSAMCNGANLAYRKTSFLEVDGFAGIDHVATGDDLLLMHKIWMQHPGEVFYLKSREALVQTEPMQTWKDFLLQRKRWASKTLVYQDYRIIVVLGFVLLFNAGFLLLVVAAIKNSHYWWMPFVFLIAKSGIEWPFIKTLATFFNQKISYLQFLLFQPLHLLYTIVVGTWSQFGKYEWKGRRVR